MPEAMIVAAVRSPIGRAVKGSLASVRPDDLVAQVIRHGLAAVPELDPADIEDLLLGCAQPAGESGFNMARIVGIQLGLDRLPGTTVNRYCGSSMQTTRMAFHAIRAGEGEVYLSAGVETVSRFDRGTADGWPGTRNEVFAEPGQRAARRVEERIQGWDDPRERGLLPDAHIPMGQTAENVAWLKGIERTEMDHFAVRSQWRAEKATDIGFWAREICPVRLPDGRTVSTDDGPRRGVTYEVVSQLPPVFRPDGRVTAGNSCPLNDGAAMLVVMSDAKVRELGLVPRARIVATAVTALSPEIMGLGPVEATRTVLRRAGMSIADIDQVEINEAFASQVLACQRELDIADDRLNVNGGAIAMGHPFGMSGARLTATLLNSLEFHDGEIGLQTMCTAGGQGMAMIVQRIS
ncbi:Beta-ketoadipyl-CoA thiolase [Micromonospora sp. MW-13]|uniref:acetyl-CoA C-acetyltransferase n=1 Tax=Micromonospora sp. MW-13 TaxID=2094022 RepID=UPI000E42E9D1|nr:acetyl-CoA C-acetyltransferase [Micromonospora sp. MW-13]RGC66817.1 Beta-ketoadipyl-CoA thiolase [Micromonospora sp. MW-13]